MYDTVIVPLDGSAMAERALDPAAEVARHTGGHLVATMVVGDERFEEHESYLAGVLARHDVPTKPPYIIPADDVAACIANAGEQERALVVMTTHGSSGVRRAVLGSVAEAVVRQLARPVLLVGPNCRPDHEMAGGRVVIPLDGSRRAEAIVEPAAEWCLSLDLAAFPVTAVDGRPGGDPAGEASYVRRIAAELSGRALTAGWEVLHGDDASDSLVTYARGLPASLVAMTTHGHTGAKRVVLGSVATHVVHESLAPVLLLRPALDGGDAD